MDDQRALLDQLMGRDRDRTREEGPSRADRWTDSDVCPYFLCGFCPNELFTNTRSDLGPCGYEKHSESLRAQFEEEDTRTRRRVQKDFVKYLRELSAECDKKVKRGKERVALNQPTAHAPSAALSAQVEKKKSDIAVRKEQLTEEITKLKGQMEELGNMGRMDDVEAMLTQLEPLEEEMKNLESMEKDLEGENAYLVLAPQARDNKNRFEVCDICGVFQAVEDAEDRKQRHYEGKQHIGMDMIRSKLKELEDMFGQEAASRTSSRYNDQRLPLLDARNALLGVA